MIRYGSLAGDEVVALEGSTPSLDTRLIRKEMNECIRGIVDNLPGDYRAVPVLRELEGFTNKETADIAGLSRRRLRPGFIGRGPDSERNSRPNAISTVMIAMSSLVTAKRVP